MTVYLNGSFLPREEAGIPVTDRGFLLGDGIYEVIRSVEGRLFRADDHLQRMRDGLNALSIPFTDSRLGDLAELSMDLLNRNGHLQGEATVYIQITRGAAWPRTHHFPKPDTEPTVFLYTDAFTPHLTLHNEGVDAITLPDLRWSRCNLKTINLLPNAMARQQAMEAGANSALMVRDGQITESPNANIFAVIGGTLRTYPLCSYILEGITRRVVLEIADNLSLPVRAVPVQVEELPLVEELFFSGTTTDIQPVTRIDGRPVGDGIPGPVTRAIQEQYRKTLYGAP